MNIVSRYHDFCMGHRVDGHENKCAHLHGHNYRITFQCTAEHLDTLGRVVDFSVIKSTLCQWLEDNWDHKFIYYQHDKVMSSIVSDSRHMGDAGRSFVAVPFNPTAENIAMYLVEEVAPILLRDTGVELIMCVVQETRKCSATYLKES